jgi:hypothetical protein
VIIGQPKSLDEFHPLAPEEVAYLATPLLQAIQQGHPLEVEVGIPLGVLCRLLATVKMLGTQAEKLTKLVPVPEAPALPILPLLRPGGVVSEQK